MMKMMTMEAPSSFMIWESLSFSQTNAHTRASKDCSLCHDVALRQKIMVVCRSYAPWRAWICGSLCVCVDVRAYALYADRKWRRIKKAFGFHSSEIKGRAFHITGHPHVHQQNL